MRKILYRGGFWTPNMGNAFIDYGSIYAIKKVMPEAKVYFASGISPWFSMRNGGNSSDSVDLAEFMEINTIVISGMAFCEGFIECKEPILKKLSDKGVKIVFSGCGGAFYNETERKHFTKFLKSINSSGFISRDEKTFENYKDCFSKSYNGIDYAFFLPNAYNYSKLTLEDYVIYNFNNVKEPEIENDRRIIRVNHFPIKFYPATAPTTNFLTIGTQKPYIKIGKRANSMGARLGNKALFVSDLPDDYLHLYANAYAVYSDLVHPCVATLAFGNYARIYSNDPRVSLIDRVGLSDVRKKLVKLDPDKINLEKENQLSFLKEILEA